MLTPDVDAIQQAVTRFASSEQLLVPYVDALIELRLGPENLVINKKVVGQYDLFANYPDLAENLQAARAHVFDPNYVWEEGPGPWLAVAYNVVKRHGGNFAFESKLKGGTAFIILLPCA